MVKRKKSKSKVKVIYRTKPIPKVPTIDESSKVKKEIEELEVKKKQVQGGWKGTFGRMSIQKQISDKAGYLKAKDKIRNIDQYTQLTKKQVELEEARARLKQAREKSKVNFEGFGTPVKTQLKMEDIFK